jgi:hypothetical protein
MTLIKTKRLFFFALCLVAVFLSTCGIETYYYLPQVPEINISTISNTSATVILPSLSSFHDFRPNYEIFYRIYTSDYLAAGTINTESERISINTVLNSDFNAIRPNTDPTSSSSGTSANILFPNRMYYELDLEGVKITNILMESGGTIEISFPTEQGGYPVLSLNGGPEYRLYRSSHFKPNERYFRNTSELNSIGYADLVSGSSSHAYVSMYVVAAGINTTNFTLIYSKPTHISIFKLPNY